MTNNVDNRFTLRIKPEERAVLQKKADAKKWSLAKYIRIKLGLEK